MRANGRKKTASTSSNAAVNNAYAGSQPINVDTEASGGSSASDALAAQEMFPWRDEQRKVIDDYFKYLDDEYSRIQQFVIDPSVKEAWPNRPTHPKSLLAGGSVDKKKTRWRRTRCVLKAKQCDVGCHCQHPVTQQVINYQ